MSSSSPPSYTSEDQTFQHDVQDVQASSVQRRKSSKEKAREISGDPDTKSETSSISRRRSRRHSSHSVDAPRLSQEIIERIARQSVRSSRHINADLLKKIAKQGGLPKDLDQEGLPKFKVITGSEATRVYEKTLREDDRASSLSHDSSKRRGARHFESRPIVLAYPGIRAGRKVVDYYMTWKGKTPKAHRLKGTGRRTDILDGEFKSLAKSFDEYGKKVKRLSGLISAEPSTPKVSTFDTEPPTPKASTLGSSSALPDISNVDDNVNAAVEPTRPTVIQVESAPAVLTTTSSNENDPLAPPRPPYARINSNGSAVSLPYLGDRLPLVVVNPDASSSSGQDSRRSSLAAGSSSKPTKDKSPLKQVLTAVEEETDDVQSNTSLKQSYIDSDSKSHHHRHAEHELDRRQRSDHHQTSPSEKRERDSSKSPTSSTESLSGSNSGRDHDKHKKSGEDEILIVLMDDKKSSWHGLPQVDRHDSKKVSISRKTSQRASPWSGPVANSRGEIHRYVPGGSGVSPFDNYDPQWDDDNDNDEDESDIDDNLILSLKARLTALGLHNSPSNSPRATPLPANSLLPSIQSPYTTNSPYLHASPATLSGHVSLYSPHSISAPNLPLSPQQPSYSLSPEPSSSSYVLPFVSGEPTSSSPWPGTANIYSPYLNSVQSPSPYTSAYQPQASLYAPSPYILNTGTSGSHVPLPAVSTYPYSNVDYTGTIDPAMYPLPPSSYSSPYVPVRETPAHY
ncbi:hypothetical protein C8J55DRAFT_151924 [Lentinula edodes]|uniref:Uncharacterized protein n=1 Tax=Lentinula lateritia TaxID=40482 RepID=A0A9W9A0N4_9AGAR|nr:hypothetical protein C8J55DRAFT_151924 [Lentinula edodes]